MRETFDTVRKAMIIDLGGKGEHGRIIGFYFFLQGLAAFPASFIGGWLWRLGPTVPFWVGGLLSALSYVIFLIFVKSKPQKAIPADTD